MANLGKTIGDLARFRRPLQGLHAAALHAGAPPGVNRLREVTGFGSNPGNLRMFVHVPERLPPAPPLVVVLHGCTQTAAGYDHGAGWSVLADRLGFALLFPEQQKANNPQGCFTWFQPGDIERDRGEPLSIRQMIARMAADHGIDPARIYVTGLSAGGAMTSVMLATYPELFAGGAIIAGLPYGAATNTQEAFAAMFQGASLPARARGDAVRAASSHRGPWPRVSVWHGSADTTVKPGNAGEIVKQWMDVHGLAGGPAYADVVNGHPHRVWCDAQGRAVIEDYTLTGMAHGTPVAPGTAEDRGGVPGAFMLDVGISSSWQIARFWGLADTRLAEAAHEAPRAEAPAAEPTREAARAMPGGVIHLPGPGAAHPAAARRAAPEEKIAEPPRAGRFDIGGAIASALRSAGLMK